MKSPSVRSAKSSEVAEFPKTCCNGSITVAHVDVIRSLSIH